MRLTAPSRRDRRHRFSFLRGRRLLGLLIVLGAFVGGILVQRSGLLGDVFHRVANLHKLTVARLTANPEVLALDVPLTELKKLSRHREEALASEILIVGADDYVKARLRHGDTGYDVKMRLKGDWTDHLQGDKWSFRIQIRGDATLFGMRRFSLHHPETRNDLNEWLYHAALRDEGLIALRYRFVRVLLNGKNLGIYGLEEHFDKRLIESNESREGPILKFNEDILWRDRKHLWPEYDPGDPTGLQDMRTSDIDSFRSSAVARDPALLAQFLKARDLLEAFRAGRLEADAVFDTEKLARYVAVSLVLGGPHALLWHNMRFYYNPITSRLEPIGFDAGAGEDLPELATTPTFLRALAGTFADRLFGDEPFYRRYVAHLDRVTDPDYVPALLARHAEGIERNTRILQYEFPWYRFDTKVFARNRRFLRKMLEPTTLVQAHLLRRDEETVRVDVANLQGMTIEVLALRVGERVLAPPRRVLMAGREFRHPVEFQTLEFPLSDERTWGPDTASTLSLDARVLGMEEVISRRVTPWPVLTPGFTGKDVLRREPNAGEFEFLAVDRGAATIRILPGRWELTRDLILPAGFVVVCDGDVHLTLGDGAKIVSRSPLALEGTEERPIVIESPDATGQGLVVLEAGGRSVLRHVRFAKLSNPAEGAWSLTGAVTFYRSPVEFHDCRFDDSRCEDSLNVVNTEFLLAGCAFDLARGDAFDGDFCRGAVRNTTFRRIGNDAVDVSGSRVELESVLIEGAGDKGVSIGERSVVTASLIDVRSAFIGVAAKDSSRLTIEGVTLRDCTYGFAIFRKKSEFGGAEVWVTDIELTGIGMLGLVERDSSLRIDGRLRPARSEAVWQRLYGD